MYHPQQDILSNEYNSNPFLFVSDILVFDRLHTHVLHRHRVVQLVVVVVVQNMVELVKY